MMDINEMDSLSDERARSIFENAYLLNHVWDVEESEARKAADSADKAIFSILCKNVPGAGFEINAWTMVEYYIENNRNQPHEGIEMILNTDWIATQAYYPNIPKFYKFVSTILSRKPQGSPAEASRVWRSLLAMLWTKGLRGAPPLCLWSDSLIISYFPFQNVPKTETAIRKEISRMGLFRPKGPCFGLGSSPSGFIKFERRSRGAVTQKK